MYFVFQRSPVFTDTPYVTCRQAGRNMASVRLCDISPPAGIKSTDY